jgi:hypothetical protein
MIESRGSQMTDDNKKLSFYIDAYSPETIPMAKLAEYMADFAALLGREHAVHFHHLEGGSTKIVSSVEFEDVSKVTTRLQEIRNRTAHKDLVQLAAKIDDRLANDNAIGRILFEAEGRGATAELLTFQGRDRPKVQSYGPFNQEGHLDGVLIGVGGKDETISVRLQNGEIAYSHCETTRVIARELGKHMFEPVRIYGTGRWLREADGNWTLRHFRVHRFDVLDDSSLRDAVAVLRAVPGSGWKDIDDPLAELDDLRRDKDELH